MPMWREYQCERCAWLFTLKDIELSGRLVCAPCLQDEMDKLTGRFQRAHWQAFITEIDDGLVAIMSTTEPSGGR